MNQASDDARGGPPGFKRLADNALNNISDTPYKAQLTPCQNSTLFKYKIVIPLCSFYLRALDQRHSPIYNSLTTVAYFRIPLN